MRRSLLWIILGLAASQASAQSCFGRFYDEAHMAAHPDQQVEEIFFGTLRGAPILQLRRKEDDSYSWSAARCNKGGGALVCTVQNGSGAFVIEDQGDGTVILGLGPHGVTLNDGIGPVSVSPQHSDDQYFRLYQGRGCLN